jgi:site-specific recombinase XerD
MRTAIITRPQPGLTRRLNSDMPWEKVLQVYLDAAIDSPGTRRAYERHVRDAMTALGASTMLDITGADLAAYRAAVLASDRAPSTQAQALAALRGFLNWARSMGASPLLAEPVAVALRGPRALLVQPLCILSDSELNALYVAAETPRDRAILAVLTGAGLRVAELVALDVTDVLEDANGGSRLFVSMGKGRRSREVPIQPEVTAAIRLYLAATGRRLGRPGPLFRAHDRAASKLHRDRLTARAVGQLVTRLAAAAGVVGKAVSPHCFRHSYAVRALRHGGNVVSVSKLLGHASITTTQRYVDHLATSELLATVPPLPWATMG